MKKSKKRSISPTLNEIEKYMKQVFPMYPFKSGVKRIDEPVFFTRDHTFAEIDKKIGGGVRIDPSEEELELIDQTVGSRDIFDLRRFLKNECCVDNVTGLKWTEILAELGLWRKRMKGKPKDLITLLVAVEDYIVSRSTLKRAIANGNLTSYRNPNKPKNSLHIISRKEVEGYYTKR